MHNWYILPLNTYIPRMQIGMTRPLCKTQILHTANALHADKTQAFPTFPTNSTLIYAEILVNFHIYDKHIFLVFFVFLGIFFLDRNLWFLPVILPLFWTFLAPPFVILCCHPTNTGHNGFLPSQKWRQRWRNAEYNGPRPASGWRLFLSNEIILLSSYRHECGIHCARTQWTPTWYCPQN